MVCGAGRSKFGGDWYVADLVKFPVRIHFQCFTASGDALDLGNKEAVTMRESSIALERLVLLVLGQQLVQILLVRHAGRLMLGHVFDAL